MLYSWWTDKCSGGKGDAWLPEKGAVLLVGKMGVQVGGKVVT